MRLRSAIAGLLIAVWATATEASQSVAKNAAIATSSPTATQVGLNVLRDGGTAIDAAVAVGFSLCVIAPHATSLGGGGFLTYYDKTLNAIWVLDFREFSPYKTDPAKKGPFTGAAAAAVPGFVSGMSEAHATFGKLPWADLLGPAIELARRGARIEPALEKELAKARAAGKLGASSPYLNASGAPLAAGTIVRNEQLAATLEKLARSGGADFYKGDIASRLVNLIREGGGVIASRDLAEYEPLWRAPLRIDFGDAQIFTVPPPSSGGVVLAQTLNVISGVSVESFRRDDHRFVHMLAEAARRASIDGRRFVGDPNHLRIPYGEIFSDEHSKVWRTSIDPNRATSTTTLLQTAVQRDHTTHISIVDPLGNVASLTLSVGEPFGSGWIPGDLGFFMNAGMNHFSVLEGSDRQPNALGPRRRMTTPVAPTIVMRDGKPFLAIGSSGGEAIASCLTQVLLDVLVNRRPLGEAVRAPRFHQQDVPDEIRSERGAWTETFRSMLNDMGHPTVVHDPIGEVNAVMIEEGKLTAVADPRYGGASGGF